jgi:carbonic anhydrase/acetyltransferase-like protein (isoleucine patch superfamily)
VTNLVAEQVTQILPNGNYLPLMKVEGVRPGWVIRISPESYSYDKVIKAFQGKYPTTNETAFVAHEAVVIGDVTIGRRSSVWFNASVRGDVNWIRVGDSTNIQDNAVVHVSSGSAPATLGDQVTVGHSAVIHGCTLYDRVLVGIGSIILDHAIINSDCIIGAGTLVTQRSEIPPRSLVLGRPARVIRTLSEEELHSIRRHADNYVRLGEIYRNAGIDALRD